MTPELIVALSIGIGGPTLSVLGIYVKAKIDARAAAALASNKDAREDESEQVSRYRVMAEQERASKESAVGSLEKVIGAYERQIEQLTTNVTNLTDTINAMSAAANVQRDLIDRISGDRDALAQTLHDVEHERDIAKAELKRARSEIRDLTFNEPITN
ncbi:hypothetical protein [Rathayibacter sp. AY2B9]|uniref:hypothetical protein n=1 Tax=Rathayibacter sp. AY2B9 TaxID=2080572 RepID=UPI000CE83975|nr:hypothetical protein [Rathayibacter sp. AY2B9]PPG34534.1 hypothetical protein C5C25_00490 [Rathayibacter sp. AY2B9]